MPENSQQPSPQEIRSWVIKLAKVWFRRTTIVLVSLWFLIVVGVLVSSRYLGERNLFTTFLLYLPQGLWALPGIFLIPFLFTVSFRWGLLLMIGVWVIIVNGLGYKIATPHDASQRRRPNELVILTNNHGQAAGQSLQPFKNLMTPDILALQETPGRAQKYLADPSYAEFKYAESLGEFTVLSRFPLRNGSLVSVVAPATGRNVTYAARFEVDWNGNPIVLYSVHLPSPRGALLAMRGGAFLYGLPAPSTSKWAMNGAKMQTFWTQQIELAENLISRVKAETLPTILAGDFNSPSVGYIHHSLTQTLLDTHLEAGSGFGYTFPGVTRNPLSLGGPWLRIDYVFCTKNWTVNWSICEPDRTSQHRAVAACLVGKN